MLTPVDTMRNSVAQKLVMLFVPWTSNLLNVGSVFIPISVWQMPLDRLDAAVNQVQKWRAQWITSLFSVENVSTVISAWLIPLVRLAVAHCLPKTQP